MRNKYLNVDSEDLEDVLKEIEKLLNIEFSENELQHVKTFGDLCDVILVKINLPQKEDCTCQQAFYKLRNSILENLTVDRSNIKPDTTLEELFTSSIQKDKIRIIENSLGFRLDILKVKKSVTLVILIGFILSIFLMFIDVLYGLVFALLVLIAYLLKGQNIKEFKVNTIREVVETMKLNNYFKARRNQNTVNKKEIIKLIEKYFIDNLATDLKEINRDTVIA